MPSDSGWSSPINTSTVLAILASSALVYSRWNRLPDWVKTPLTSSDKNIDFSDSNKEVNDELASLSAVLSKLKEMMALVSQVSDNATPDYLTDLQMLAAFYSLVHLDKELRGLDPDYRDKQYEDADRVQQTVGIEELKELSSMLKYADWAYEESYIKINADCRETGLDLLRHDPATEPGRVGHFIALDHSKKKAIIGLKGTDSLADVLTDLVALPREHTGCNFDDNISSAGTNGREHAPKSMHCHEGIFTAALWMADNVEEFIKNMLLPLNYQILLCGHSLGAGTACLLGMELRSRIPALRKNYTDLKVMAFAAPPAVSFEASRACAPFITSVVNDADAVPRASLKNLVVMNKLILKVNDKLQARGYKLDSWKNIYNYYLEEVAVVDEDLLLTPKELNEFYEDTHAAPEEEPDQLYIPGRCVVMFDKGDNDNHEIGGIVTDCGMKMLRLIELSTTMVKDHMVSSYRANLEKLIRQLEDT